MNGAGPVSDARGSIVYSSDRYDSAASRVINTYDEYGQPGASNEGRFQYTGQVWLPELGLGFGQRPRRCRRLRYYYKARIYSPTLGRFLQTDPIGYEDQFNLYAYVGNDPINSVDPTGLCGEGGHAIRGCRVIGKRSASRSPSIDPTDFSAVNNHAWYGDGSVRYADFSKVSLADLGGSIQRLASDPSSALGQAIAASRASGAAETINIDNLKAGGSILGRTPVSQQGAIGRFSVALQGTVTATSNGWTLQGTVTGELDRQDYVSSDRNLIGEALTRYGRWRQDLGGGSNYDILFVGSQDIEVISPEPIPDIECLAC